MRVICFILFLGFLLTGSAAFAKGKKSAHGKHSAAKTASHHHKTSRHRHLPAQAVEASHATPETAMGCEEEIIDLKTLLLQQDLPLQATTTVEKNKNSSYTKTTTQIILPKKEEKKAETSFTESVMDWIKDKYSGMMEILPNQISNVMLYRFIDDWYGVKYRMGGSSKNGIDCSAFVQNLYKYVFGLDLLRTASMQFNTSELIQDPSQLKEGDLVFFRVRSSRISHVGVYLCNNFFVHSASSKGVSISNLSSTYWSRYFAGGGRILLPKS